MSKSYIKVFCKKKTFFGTRLVYLVLTCPSAVFVELLGVKTMMQIQSPQSINSKLFLIVQLTAQEYEVPG